MFFWYLTVNTRGNGSRTVTVMFNKPKKYKLKPKNEKNGSVYFGIVSRRRPPKSKTAIKKWQLLTGISGSISSEWVAGFAPDYPIM